MKRSILTFALGFFMSVAVFAHGPGKPAAAKQDTLVQLTMPLNDYKAFEAVINTNIDSKTATKQMIEFLRQRLRVVQQAAPDSARTAPAKKLKK